MKMRKSYTFNRQLVFGSSVYIYLQSIEIKMFFSFLNFDTKLRSEQYTTSHLSNCVFWALPPKYPKQIQSCLNPLPFWKTFVLYANKQLFSRCVVSKAVVNTTTWARFCFIFLPVDILTDLRNTKLYPTFTKAFSSILTPSYSIQPSWIHH